MSLNLPESSGNQKRSSDAEEGDDNHRGLETPEVPYFYRYLRSAFNRALEA